MASVEGVDWFARAECLGQTDLMFDQYRRAEALALCVACPVQPECREYMATQHGWSWAVIAGTTPESRNEKLLRWQTTREYRQELHCRFCKTIFVITNPGSLRQYCSANCRKMHSKWSRGEPGRAPAAGEREVLNV